MKKFLIVCAVLFALAGIGIAGGSIMLYMWASDGLPGFKKITDYRPPLVTTVYARDGQVLGYFYREKRFLVRLDEMPPHLAKAFIAAEDSSFYEHEGVDLTAIGRAMYKNLQAGGIKQGGSTITQQIIKRLLLTSEKSYERKIKEAILAYRLERYLTKDEILTIYLNQIFLGARSYGVEAAARTYFGKHVKDLTLAESAVLAGLPQAPSRYNPLRHPEAAHARQLYVLRNMLELKWITQAEYDQALAQPLVYKSMPDPSWKLGAYYLEEVRRRLLDYLTEENAKKFGLDIDRFGEDAVYEAGLHVYTAVDLKHQAAAEKALREGLIDSTRRRGWRGPVAHLEKAEYAAFLKEKKAPQPEEPDHVYTPGPWLLARVDGKPVLAQTNATFGAGLVHNGTVVEAPTDWVQVLVTEVSEHGARVATGQWTGWMGVETMAWGRKPDPDRAPEEAQKIKDARVVVAPGDVVWASVVTPNAKTLADKTYQAQGYIPLNFALEQLPDVEGALVSMEPKDGGVVALVGGFGFHTSQFNRATQAFRQPGSAFKPIVYSTAMDNGFTPASIVLDAPIVYTDFSTDTVWRPENYEGVFYGPTLLRTALVKSRNLVTIRVAQKIGIDKIIARAKDMGLEGDFQPNLSVSLGSVAVTPLNLCHAYTTFARGGTRIKPRLILRATSAWGVELMRNDPVVTEAMTPQTAYIMSSLLKEVVQDGTGWRARVLGRPVAGKTGTTNDEQDAWYMGFSPYLLSGVYVGFDQVQPMGKYETGSRAASPIWVAYRQAVEEDYPVEDFPEPPGIVHVRIDGQTGMLASPSSQTSYFLPFKVGTEPNRTAGAPPEAGGDTSTSGEELLKQVY